MSFLPESEAELARQIAYALEDESFHPLDEVQDHSPEDCRYFSDLECSLSEWSFCYGLAWAIARMRDPFAPTPRIKALAQQLARDGWRAYGRGEPWPNLMSKDRADRGPVRGDPSPELEAFTRSLGSMRVRRPPGAPRVPGSNQDT